MQRTIATTLTFTLMLGAAEALAVPMIFSDVGAAPADIEDTVQAFRDELGALNPFEPVSFAGGHRSIDWDAAPDAVSDPNAFPRDFFNGDALPRARGIAFREEGTTSGFRLSSTQASGTPVEFGLDAEFQTFSPERLFAPVGGTMFDVLFFDPSDQVTPATTRGLGVVFTGISEPGSVSMTFRDVEGNVLETLFGPVPLVVDGLTFLGLVLDDPEIFTVSIIAGTLSIDGVGMGTDQVAMDDFIFGEPVSAAVPLPAPLLSLGAGIGLLLLAGRGRRAAD